MIINLSNKRLKRRHQIELGFFTILVLITVSIVSFVIFQPITVLPRITLAPGFSLVDQNYKQVSNEDLRGQLVLYSFGSTTCVSCKQDVEALTAVYQTLSAQLPADSDLQFVTISLTPDEDSPPHLTKTDIITQNALSWQWLTGDPLRVRYAVGGGFDLYYQDGANGDVDFEPLYVLVDRFGVIRARYFTAVPDTALLLRDINFLTEEAKNDSGSKKLAYEAAHLFLCYPR